MTTPTPTPTPTSGDLTREELAALRTTYEKCRSEDEWAKDRMNLVLCASDQQNVVLYDDHDWCAEFHDDAGMGWWGQNYAAFLVEAFNRFPALVAMALRTLDAESELAAARVRIAELEKSLSEGGTHL